LNACQLDRHLLTGGLTYSKYQWKEKTYNDVSTPHFKTFNDLLIVKYL
jgi:hypothetical protein